MFDVSSYIEELDGRFASPFRHVADQLDVPEHWVDYCADSKAQRLLGVARELSQISTYFPYTVEGLRPLIVDSFLAKNADLGLCRFFVTELRGERYLTYSCAPKAFVELSSREELQLFQKRAPEALVWIYNNVMDGLTDLYDFAGFKSSVRIARMSDDLNLWGEFDWFEAFSRQRDLRNVIELLSSGGGAYLMLDLNSNLSDLFEPRALLVNTSNSISFPEEVDLFPYLDTWMAIGLAEVDFD